MTSRRADEIDCGGRLKGRPKRLRPKDAATLVLVDRSGAEPRILMGRRRASEVFLPNKFVFPGGRLDRADWTAPAADALPERETERLLFDMKGRPSSERARALALTAVREMFEEAGLLLGCTHPTGGGSALSRHPSWIRFLRTGHLPALSGLTFFARAITPPARPRRYDTRFFMADAASIAAASERPDE
ncbi:MAG: NUDIX hydrolase, partial [Hyphomicrobiaceae bacterium]